MKGYPPLKPIISFDEAEQALALFHQGKDTKQIAWDLEATESAVYNGINQLRTYFPERLRRQKEVA